MGAVCARSEDLIGDGIYFIIPGVGQKSGVESHLPLGDVSIVATPPIDHRDGPHAIERASDKVGEGLVWVIEVRHVDCIGRVNDAIVNIGHIIHTTGARSIAVAIGRIGVVGPAIVPCRADFILLRIALVVSIVGISDYAEMGGRIDVGSLLPSPRQGNGTGTGSGARRTILVHNLDRLAVGTSQRNIDISDIGVFHFDSQVKNVVCAGNSSHRGEGVENHGRLVGTTTAAVDTVGQENGVRHIQDCQLLAINGVQFHHAVIIIAEGHIHLQTTADRRWVGKLFHRCARGTHSEGDGHCGHATAYVRRVD